MKFLLLALSFALFLAPRPAAAAGSAGADEAFAQLQALGGPHFKVPESLGARSLHDQWAWYGQHSVDVAQKAFAFYAAYPADPRRWDAVVLALSAAPRFVKSYGPNVATDPDDVVIDAEATAAWRANLAGLSAAMAAATDLTPAMREKLDAGLMDEVVTSSLRAKAADWTATIRAIADFGTKYPSSHAAADVARGAMYTLESKSTPAQAAAAWRTLAATPNTALTAMATNKAKAFAEITSGPMDLAFTGLNGSPVDVKLLRGKVVLVDFWATWCGPCMAEMPNVKRVYQAWHDKGFEIVGISCDVAPGPGCSPQWVKAAKTGPQVLEFTRTNGMPWPEQYEGKKHNEGGNALAARFAVTGIPASFLLDSAGNVVALNLRGPALEAKVKELLKVQD